MSNCGRHLDSVQQNSFLPLEDHVLGPLHEPGEVSLGLHVVTHSEIAGLLLEEGVRFLLDLLGTFLSFLSLGLR